MRPKKQTAITKHFRELIQTFGGGSQKKFAEIVGCAPSLISKVVNGTQLPGHDLVERILKLELKDPSVLQNLVAKASGDGGEFVPLARHLLPGSPIDHASELLNQQIEIPARLAHPSVYAVQAVHCVTHRRLSIKFRNAELLIIDAAPDRCGEDLKVFEGKICVYDSTSGLELRDSKVETFQPEPNQPEMYGGRELRHITLSDPPASKGGKANKSKSGKENKKPIQKKFEAVDKSKIKGIVLISIQLI